LVNRSKQTIFGRVKAGCDDYISKSIDREELKIIPSKYVSAGDISD